MKRGRRRQPWLATSRVDVDSQIPAAQIVGLVAAAQSGKAPVQRLEAIRSSGQTRGGSDE